MMKPYPALSKTLDKKQYEKYDGKKVKFGRYICTVRVVESENRVGSYERGIAWTHRSYGVLLRGREGNWSASANHGQTWRPLFGTHPYDYSDFKYVIREAKNKVILGDSMTKELAFEGIQAINRKWEGPNYRWRK
jgi:hypothetical protein